MSMSTVPEFRWTALTRGPDGSYSRIVTKEQHAWLTRQWCDDWTIVVEDWYRWGPGRFESKKLDNQQE